MQTNDVITWVVLHCSECSAPMAMPQQFEKNRRRDRKTFYCLNGHSQWFPGKTDAQLASEAKEEAERERVRTRQVRDQLEATQRSLAATKGALTKTRKRIGNGACPCCKRHFKDVERHMANKHPEVKNG